MHKEVLINFQMYDIYISVINAGQLQTYHQNYDNNNNNNHHHHHHHLFRSRYNHQTIQHDNT